MLDRCSDGGKRSASIVGNCGCCDCEDLVVRIDKKLEDYLHQLPITDIAHVIAGLSKHDVFFIEDMLSTFINEARATLQVVKPYLSKDISILEVGAGLCILSLFLKKENYNIVALEPSSGGFDYFDVAKNVITDMHSDVQLEVIEIEAGQLEPGKDGPFDLIFSNNVIEHIPNLEQAMDAMVGVLNIGGKMVHACPNYVVPYEPHLRVFVLKPWIRLSEILFKDKIEQQKDLWNSLNFITYFDVTSFAKHRNLRVNFVSGLLYQAFRRFDNDELFSSRQGRGWVKGAYTVLRLTGLIYLLKYLPVFLSTPMIIEISANNALRPEEVELPQLGKP